jgi:histidine triad (HIT) family protein
VSEDTIFQKIVRGEIPADIVHQDDMVTAFRDINPLAPVHVLVVPNRVIPTADDVHGPRGVRDRPRGGRRG